MWWTSLVGTSDSKPGGIFIAGSQLTESPVSRTYPLYIRGTGPVPPEEVSAPLFVDGIGLKTATASGFILGSALISTSATLNTLGYDPLLYQGRFFQSRLGHLYSQLGNFTLATTGVDMYRSRNCTMFIRGTLPDSNIMVPTEEGMPLFLRGAIIKNSPSVPLITGDIPKVDVPLYLHNTDLPESRDVPMFIRGSNVGVNEHLVASTLYIVSDEEGNLKKLSIPLYLRGATDPAKAQIPLFIKGGGFPIVGSVSMFACNNWGGLSQSQTLYIEGDGLFDGSMVSRVAIPLFLKRVPSVFTPLFLKGEPELVMTQNPLVLIGAGVTNKGVPLVMPNTTDETNVSNSLFTRGF